MKPATGLVAWPIVKNSAGIRTPRTVVSGEVTIIHYLVSDARPAISTRQA
jgi:hypothetical protein